MVSEFNEDVPGGFNEAAGIPELLGSPGAALAWEGDFRGLVVEALRPYDTIALLYATSYAEDLQHMLVLEDWLRSAGHDTVLASPEHLEEALRLRRSRRPALLRPPGRRRLPLLPGRVDGAAPQPRGVATLRPPPADDEPPPRPRPPEQDAVRAVADDADLPPEDRELIARHLPHTEPFRPERLDELPRGARTLGPQARLRPDGRRRRASGRSCRPPSGTARSRARRATRTPTASRSASASERPVRLRAALSRPRRLPRQRPLRRLLQPGREPTLHLPRGPPCRDVGPRRLRRWGASGSPGSSPHPSSAVPRGRRSHRRRRPRRQRVARLPRPRAPVRRLGPAPGRAVGSVPLRAAVRGAGSAEARRHRARRAAGVPEATQRAAGAAAARPPGAPAPHWLTPSTWTILDLPGARSVEAAAGSSARPARSPCAPSTTGRTSAAC
jgi:hypothetical protein